MGGNTSVALVGIGGYGSYYVDALLQAAAPYPFRFVAGVDPFPQGCKRLPEMRQGGVAIYPSLEACFAETSPDLVVLSSPLHLHAEQTCLALDHGSHVLCEKPLGSHPQQIAQMMEARDRAGKQAGSQGKKQAAIGYQWSFSAPVQALKRDIAAGAFGRPRRFKTLIFWPRDERYYRRSAWAGRQRDDAGRWVLDSPVNNACAHFLHNMFYVLGERPDRSAEPQTVQAELFRANAIENYDTAALRCRTRGGVDLLFIASHATENAREPVFCYEFDDATVWFGSEYGESITAVRKDGSRVVYGRPASSDSTQKLWDVIGAIRGGEAVACGPEAAGAQTACMFAAQQSAEIIDFPGEMIRIVGPPGERRSFATGLEETLNRCYDEFRLPSELGAAWTAGGKTVTLAAPAESGQV